MKKEWIIIGTVLGILGALLSVLLPLGNALAVRVENKQLVQELERGVPDRQREYALAKWYNYHLQQQGSGAWQACYSSILNLAQDALGVLEIPGQQLPVCHGRDPAPGRAGHDPDSPLPLGSAGSHTVLFLPEDPGLNPGQELKLRCLDLELRYRVQSVQVMPGRWSTAMLCLDRRSFLTLAVDQGRSRILIRCVQIPDAV